MVEEQVVEARVVEIREGKVLSGVAGTWYRTVTKDPHPARPRIQSNPARPSAMMYCPSCGGEGGGGGRKAGVGGSRWRWKTKWTWIRSSRTRRGGGRCRWGFGSCGTR